MELEEAYALRKDPRSLSQIFCCKLCLVGPKKHACSARVANTFHFIVIALNVLALAKFEDEKWNWLIISNIFLGCLSWLLMCCVQCSDPGIINRNQD